MVYKSLDLKMSKFKSFINYLIILFWFNFYYNNCLPMYYLNVVYDYRNFQLIMIKRILKGIEEIKL
jgi:hypothetical protein